ncbi:MAG: hypothetical protein HRF50_12255 [Phycisphaerae bacterium]|jgi:hypothetical protein
MLTAFSCHLLRSASGLGLLLVLATQQKVCPWPVAPAVAAAAARRAEAAPPPGADERGSSRRRTLPPLTLAAALPDAVHVRWNAGALETERRIGSARERSQSPGRLPSERAAHGALSLCAWPVPAGFQPGRAAAIEAEASMFARRRVPLGSVSPTGPPAV